MKEDLENSNRRYRDENIEKIKIEDQLLSAEAERDKAISFSQSIQESHAQADEEIGRLKRRVDELLLEKSALNNLNLLYYPYLISQETDLENKLGEANTALSKMSGRVIDLEHQTRDLTVDGLPSNDFMTI